MSPLAVLAENIPPRQRPSNYPEAIKKLLSAKLAGRSKIALGDFFALSNFGVNLTKLAPGACSALPHAHSKQDEFIYILTGTPSLVTGGQEELLSPGMCAGFKAGSAKEHYLINHSAEEVIYLEVGDRSSNDEVHYPEHDLHAKYQSGNWVFYHKDGRPFTDTPAPDEPSPVATEK